MLIKYTGNVWLVFIGYNYYFRCDRQTIDGIIQQELYVRLVYTGDIREKGGVCPH